MDDHPPAPASTTAGASAPLTTDPGNRHAPPHDAPGGGATRGRRGSPWKGVLVALALAAVAAGAAYYLYPKVTLALSTVSTDDAFVNAHVTHVAPRISENVLEVRVDDNDRVRRGDLLIVLDDTLWKVRAAQAEASLEVARKAETEALAKARSLAAQSKANRFQLASAISGVKNQVAGLRAAIARWREAEAAEKLARLEATRFTELARKNSVTQEQADVRQSDYDQARARTRQALEEVHRSRVGLEVPEEPPAGKPYDDVPADLDQKHSSVVSALGTLTVSLAELGLPLPRYYDTPDEFLANLRQSAPNGDVDALIEKTVENAPGVLSSRAQVRQAEESLAEARLNLSYCQIRADIDGFVSNRSVNPGDRVAQGQRLLAIRDLNHVWIDANFKETQLDPVRIGQPVDIYVDTYPGRVFRGRVSGFNPGTGSSLALLPAQNATGNFVKIVQRLPVRIDLVGGNPTDTPLLIGLSAVPYVRIRDHPEGPDAGRRLRGAGALPDVGAGRPTSGPSAPK